MNKLSTLIMGYLIFFTQICNADLNPGPRGYHWKWSTSEDGETRAELIHPTRGKSNIFYLWSRGGSLVASRNFDDENGLFSTFPERSLSMAHPSQAQALEGQFLNILRDVGFEIEKNKLMIQSKEGLRPRPFLDIIKQLESMRSTLTVDQHLKSISTSVSKTREAIVTQTVGLNKGNKFSKWISWASSALDIIQPIHSAGATAETSRFDAFALLSSEVFRENPKQFLSLLYRTAAKPLWNPMTWFRMEENASERQKLAVISLITHNHVSEAIFTQTVALTYGPREAWRVFQSINRLYESEQNFWFSADFPGQIPMMRRNSELPHLLERSKVDFYDRDNSLEVRFDFSRLGCGKPQQSEGWIPIRKTYHAYGGFIAGRLLRERFIPQSIVKQVVVRLGRQYKRLSSGKDSPEMDMIDRIYSQAAIESASCMSYPDSKRIKENLVIMVDGGNNPLSALNVMSEPALAKLIAVRAGKDYDRVAIWTKSWGIDAIDFLKSVNAQIDVGGHVDVISIQHGPNSSFVPGKNATEVESVFPRGRVRNVISSGCSMWGDMAFVDGKWQAKWQSDFGLHMKRMGVKSYLIFANSTSHWWRISSDLSKRLSPKKDWALAALDFVDQIETDNLNHPNRSGLLDALKYPVSSGRPIIGVDTNRTSFDNGDSRIELVLDHGDGLEEFSLSNSR